MRCVRKLEACLQTRAIFYRLKEVVANIYRNDYAISVCDSTGCKSPTIVAAQTANELLNINGIKASFVFTEYQGKVYLSARSIDELNVQVVTEKLGGGGHMNIAGAQFEGISVEEAIDRLTTASFIEL